MKLEVLDERQEAKYFAVLVDATPDASHNEQNTFILRYVSRVFCEGSYAYEIRERFLEFVDLNDKTGLDISNMILTTIGSKGIPFEDCRGQGYDNCANTSGKFNSAQSQILKKK